MKNSTHLFTALLYCLLFNSYAVESNPPSFLSSAEFSVSLSVSLSDVDSLENAMQFVAKASFSEFMQEQVELGNQGTQSINSISKIEEKFLEQNPQSSYLQEDLVTRARLLREFALTAAQLEVPNSILISDLAVNQMINSPTQWKENLSAVKDHLSFEEKIRLTSYLGGRFSSDYNSDRSAAGLAAEGIVSIEEMLENLSNDNPGGICRDVTLAQSQILQQLGINKKNIYQMSYAVAKGHHAVLLVQDPTNPTKVIKINYSLVQTNENVAGSSSLSQDGILADTGIVYKIYDADGKSVGNIPSEMGRVLRDITNYEDSVDQGVSPYQLTKTIIRSRWIDATIFSGALSNGDQVEGVSFNKSFESESNPREFGIAYLERSGNSKQDSSIDQQALFLRVKELQRRERQIGPIIIRGHAGTEIEGALLVSRIEAKSTGKVIEGNTIDAHGSVFAGAEIEYTTDAATYLAGVNIVSVIDFNNLAGAASSGYGIFLDETQISLGVEKQISSEVKASGRVLITMKNVGEVAAVNLGIDKNEGQSTLDFVYQAPLSEIPIFMEGSTQVIRFGASQNIPMKGRRFSTGRFYIGGAYDQTVQRSHGQVGIEFKF